jgi:hypothetical protein
MSHPIDSIGPTDSEPDRESSLAEFSAWGMRRRLPSELVHKLALRWPEDVSDSTGIPESTLKAQRGLGDHPRLYGIGRKLFTTHDDLREWIARHELEPGQLIRPATIPRGSKRHRAEVSA